MKKIQILTLSACTVQGCIAETDAAKSGSNAQNAASGAMTAGKRFFAFSATLNKCYARLPQLQRLAKHVCTSLSGKFSFDTVINSSLFFPPQAF